MRKILFSFGALAMVLAPALCQQPAPTHLVEQAPVQVTRVAADTWLVDFGKVAFGNLLVTPAAGEKSLTVRFGEKLKDGRIDTQPPGSVRYAEVTVSPGESAAPLVVAPPPDKRNTTPPAVLTPAAWQPLIPFRWAEIQGWTGVLKPDAVKRRAAFDSSWDDSAASFHSSDAMLDRVWALSHDSIKATTFAGVFVDGDRERIAYEADAYLNQLGYYAGDVDPRMPRATFDRLMHFPTWPTEWAPHMVFMAYADWMQNGDATWLRAHYVGLKTKLLEERVGADGLVTSSAEQIRRGDIVDWPIAERDGYVFTGVNTVVNAFHLRALGEMSLLAEAVGKPQEAEAYRMERAKALTAFQAKLFDPAQALFRDGVGTEHASLHANLFPLAFGLVPEAERAHVAAWLANRGMRGSVYAAQYLLEGLFENGQSTAALALMTAPGDRSWRHMVESGTTITWEAWDQAYKPNQDWNHAWGAAPANLLPRFVLGVQPLAPGWAEARVQPHPGTLRSAEGSVPTPRGKVRVKWTAAGKTFQLALTLPAGVRGRVMLPAVEGAKEVRLGGKRVRAQREGAWWVLQDAVSGSVTLEER